MTKAKMMVAAFALAACSAETAEEHVTSDESAISVEDIYVLDERGEPKTEEDPETHALYSARLEVVDSRVSVDARGNLQHSAIHVVVRGSASGGDLGSGFHLVYRLGAAAAIFARCGADPWHLVESTKQKASWGRSDLQPDWLTLLGGIDPANVDCNPGDDVEIGFGVWYAAYASAPAEPNGERAVVERWRCFPRAACSAVSATSD